MLVFHETIPVGAVAVFRWRCAVVRVVGTKAGHTEVVALLVAVVVHHGVMAELPALAVVDLPTRMVAVIGRLREARPHAGILWTAKRPRVEVPLRVHALMIAWENVAVRARGPHCPVGR